jgi:hypothetical protein
MNIKNLAEQPVKTIADCNSCAGSDVVECPHRYALFEIATGFVDRWGCAFVECMEYADEKWAVLDQETGEVFNAGIAD